MKVLWLSVTPSLYDEKKYGGWIASLERILKKNTEIELGITFEYPEQKEKCISGNTTYYPIYVHKSIKDKVLNKFIEQYDWKKLISSIIGVIEDFKPDIIQCFGSEWPYGDIVNYTNIPVVIHMQGFANIYNESSNIAFSNADWIKCNMLNPKAIIMNILNLKRIKYGNQFERSLMKKNRFFLGRTEWDKSIVKYYSPDSRYFYCPEALRPEIFDSPEKWKYQEREKKKLVTITQAGVLKGNEMILRTAKLLKEQFCFSFEWRVAGNIETFKLAEKKTGINHGEYNIKLLGLISATDVTENLLNSDVYVHPAIIDNSPNSLCEAQVLGCPVIAANVGGIPGLVEDRKTGILYPYNEPHTLAFRIMDLLSDKKLMVDLSENEIYVANQRHNPEMLSRTIQSIYSNILEDVNE